MKINRLRALRGYMAHCGLNKPLDQLASQRETRSVSHEFCQLVPAHISENCSLVLFRNRELMIYTSNAQWANWLHNRSNRIFTYLNDKGIIISKLRIHNSPGLNKLGERERNKPDQPPIKAAECVHRTAQSISDDKLKQSLSRLADKLASKSKSQH